MKYLITLLTAGLLGNLLLMAPLPAAEIPDPGSASALSESGRIDTINLKDGYLIVDDTRYALAPEITVRSASGATVPVSALRRGMRIAFALQPVRVAGAQTITVLVIRADR